MRSSSFFEDMLSSAGELGRGVTCREVSSVVWPDMVVVCPVQARTNPFEARYLTET